MVFNVNDRYVGRSLDLYGEYSEGEVALFRQLLRVGDVAVDAGANIGAHTLALARLVGESGAVVAFEPQRIPFQALCANLALNSIANVIAHQAALGEAPGAVVVPPIDYRKPGNFGGVALGGHEKGERVPVVTIDGLGLGACRLLKVDVEGMEAAVLRGARTTIERHHPVLYVENDRNESAAPLLRLIAGFGYRIYRHEPRLFNPANFLGNQANVFGAIVSRNILCVHTSQRIDVQGGEPLAVPGGPG
jgi:FkbM family methyltransferase